MVKGTLRLELANYSLHTRSFLRFAIQPDFVVIALMLFKRFENLQLLDSNNLCEIYGRITPPSLQRITRQVHHLLFEHCLPCMARDSSALKQCGSRTPGTYTHAPSALLVHRVAGLDRREASRGVENGKTDNASAGHSSLCYCAAPRNSGWCDRIGIAHIVMVDQRDWQTKSWTLTTMSVAADRLIKLLL